LSEAGIIRSIEQLVNGTAYSSWTIGITNDPNRRYREHAANGKDVSRFTYWNAGNESSARRIEAICLSRGMEGDTGGGINPIYVYVF